RRRPRWSTKSDRRPQGRCRRMTPGRAIGAAVGVSASEVFRSGAVPPGDRSAPGAPRYLDRPTPGTGQPGVRSMSQARIHARIAGTGSYLPEKVLTNDDLAKIVDTSDEWIAARTGIRERHVAAEGETTSDLGYRAALGALEAAGVDASELDLVVVGTTSPDLTFQSAACLFQHKLGVAGCPAFDVNAACSGFIYGLTIADKFIRSGA